MARPLRVIYRNAWYHVMNRGTGRRKIFYTKKHRELFLSLLEEAYQIFGLEIHAYCLMDNHYHLLVCTPNANLSRAMRHINGVYTQRLNRLMKTDGVLFRGRYKAKLVDDDCYQLVVSRYIHLNPVEAKIVRRPIHYQWSSYQAYLSEAPKPEWLTTRVILTQIEERKQSLTINSYQDYVERTEISEMTKFFSIKYTSAIIGSEQFKQSILDKLSEKQHKLHREEINRISAKPTVDKIIQFVCEYYKVSRQSLLHSKAGQLNWSKQVALYISRKLFGFSIAEIKDVFFNMKESAVTSAIYRCGKRMQNSKKLQKEVALIINQIQEDR